MNYSSTDQGVRCTSSTRSLTQTQKWFRTPLVSVVSSSVRKQVPQKASSSQDEFTFGAAPYNQVPTNTNFKTPLGQVLAARYSAIEQ